MRTFSAPLTPAPVRTFCLPLSTRTAGAWAQRAALFLANIPDTELRADLRERFEERAGIMECNGNLGRDEAERVAYEDLCRNVGQG